VWPAKPLLLQLVMMVQSLQTLTWCMAARFLKSFKLQQLEHVLLVRFSGTRTTRHLDTCWPARTAASSRAVAPSSPAAAVRAAAGCPYGQARYIMQQQAIQAGAAPAPGNPMPWRRLVNRDINAARCILANGHVSCFASRNEQRFVVVIQRQITTGLGVLS
jgi:hypothetical protein